MSPLMRLPRLALLTAVTVTVWGVLQLVLLKFRELLIWPLIEKKAAAVALLLERVKSEMAESEPGWVLKPTGLDQV